MMVTHLTWTHSSQPCPEMVSLHQEMHLQPHGAETSKHFRYQCFSTSCWSSDPVSCQYQQHPLPNVPAGPFIQNSMVSHDSSRATKPKPPTQPDQTLLQTSCHSLLVDTYCGCSSMFNSLFSLEKKNGFILVITNS